MSVLDPFLSERGHAVRMPPGIRVWGERAAKAGGLDATMGVVTAPAGMLDPAAGADSIAYLPAIRAAFAGWTPAEVFPYAPVAGLPAFRQGWRRWIAGKAAGSFEPESAAEEDRLTSPVATAGVTGGLCATALLVLDPGDPVLVPAHRWDGYDTTFGSVAGARLEGVPLLSGGAWDVAGWARAMEARAAAGQRVVCVLNFPHNPTGYVPTADEAEAFAAAAAAVAEASGRPVVVICDDAYEGYVYTDRPAGSVFYRLIDRHPRLLPVKCDGITKELLFWGGRLGAVTAALPRSGDPAERAAAAAEWEAKLSAVVRGMISSASTAVQSLVARVLADPEALLAAREPILRLLAERRVAMAAALETDAARKAFQADPFHGGLFALLHLRRGDAVAVAEGLLEERRIGVVPFRDPEGGLNALRITYATLPTERIADVVDQAAELVLG